VNEVAPPFVSQSRAAARASCAMFLTHIRPSRRPCILSDTMLLWMKMRWSRREWWTRDGAGRGVPSQSC
jgi:hypothetical protein